MLGPSRKGDATMKLKLEEWLNRRNVSQSQIAEALGISRQSVNAWIKPKMRDGEEVRIYPDFKTFEKLCLFLEVTPNDLLEIEPSRASIEKTWHAYGRQKASP